MYMELKYTLTQIAYFSKAISQPQRNACGIYFSFRPQLVSSWVRIPILDLFSGYLYEAVLGCWVGTRVVSPK